MSWLSVLSNLTKNVGHGAEDLFTLGGTEIARKYGGQGARNVLNPLATGLGANFEAGAVGGSGMMGAQGLGAFGAGSSGTAGMGTPNMAAAGSTLGAGGASSPLSLGGYGASGGMGGGGGQMVAGGASPISRYLQMARGGQGQQQVQPTQNPLEQLYAMYPNLRPSMGGLRGT